jgi:hypothetical protein
MLGRWRQAAWIAAFACIAFGFGYGFEIWRASQQTHAPQYGYHSGQSQKEDNPTSGKGEGHKSLWERTWEDPVAFFTLWIAIFTCVLAASTIGLWIATILTLRHSRETAERQLRAYLTIEGGGVLLLNGNTISANVKFRNTGQTPAYDVMTWAGVFVAARNSPFPVAPSVENRGDAKSITGPGQDVNINRRTPITPAELDAVRATTMAIFFGSRIDYVDAFKEKRHFVFKEQIVGPDIPLPVGSATFPGWELQPDPSGYDAN